VNPSAAPSSPLNGSAAQGACPVCHASELETRRPGRDRLFALAKGAFALFRCRSCGCIFQHPFPDRSALAAFYPKDYWWSESAARGNRAARILQSLEKTYREFVIKDHVRFLDECARRHPQQGKLLLDIGCGNGTFLHSARSRGFIAHGMDASARAVEIARRQYGFPVCQGEVGSRVWDGSRFDFITMFHILEHLPDPGSALKYARELMRPGGVLILQVPNISSVQARLFSGRWYGLDVPRHLINFTPGALAFLLEEAGFEFRLETRFSLRDNPASIASSLAPWLDPIHRKGTGADSTPVLSGVLEAAYFGLFLLSVLPALLESACGRGGTLWACAIPK